MDDRRVYDLNLWMIFWGIVGARVLHLVADGQWSDYVNLCRNPKLVEAIDAQVTTCTAAAQCGFDYLCDAVRHVCYPPRDCLAVLEIWRGGFAYYGGFLFASAFGLFYARKHRLGMWRTADLAAYGIALGLFFGRMGCYLNGCCYGKRCATGWGVVFPRGGAVWRAQLKAHLISPLAGALPVYPTQLLEAIGCLGLFFGCYYLARRRKRAHGEVFAWFVAGYALLRFLLELLRDDDRGLWFGGALSTSQLLSLPLFAAAVFALLRLHRQAARSHAPHPV